MHRVSRLVGHLGDKSLESLTPNPTSAFRSTQDRVTIEVKDGIAVVTMNRPDKKNALDAAMLLALTEAGKYLQTAPGVRVVVLTGAGASFCSGLDLATLKTLNKEGASIARPYDERGISHVAQQSTWTWQELPMPVIAAVKGHAIGGGCQLALGADIRFVHPDTQLSIRETFWGLIPDMGVTVYLRNLRVRSDIAKELIWTAKMFSGTEAHAWGLATHLSNDPLASAMALAAEICSRSPHAVRAGKRLLNRQQHDTVASQLKDERTEIMGLIGTPNQMEAVMSGMQKRPPKFADLS